MPPHTGIVARLLTATVALGGLLALSPTVGAAAATDPAPTTALVVRVGAGGDGPATANTAVSVSDPAQLTVRQEDTGLTMAATSVAGSDVWVVPYAGEQLFPGTFQASGPKDSQRPGTVFVTVGNCIISAGAPVRVRDVEYAADGTLLRLAVDITGECVGYTTSREVQLRYRSTVPWFGISAPASIDVGLVSLGYPVERTVTVRVDGTVPVELGTPHITVDPTRSGDVVVKAETCSHRVFTGGQTCTVTLRVTPSGPDHLWASLDLPDGTSFGSTVATTVEADGWQVADGTFHPYGVRAFDSRSNGTLRPLQAGTTLDVPLGNRPPAGGCGYESAEVFAITVTQPERNGFVTAFAGAQRPGTSSLNVVKGETRTNLVTVPAPVACSGLRLYTSTTTHVVVDWVGYYADGSGRYGSQFDLVSPQRVVDTRSTAPLGPRSTATVALDLGDGFNHDVTAVAVNLTALSGARGGFLHAWDGLLSGPTSSVTFAANQTVASAAIVPVQVHPDGPPTLAIENGSSSTTHVLVDVVGVYYTNHPAGLRYSAVAQQRILDTRSRLGASPLGHRTISTIPVPLTSVVAGTEALVGNLTAVAPQLSTYLTAWASGTRPATSTLNAAAGQVVANAAVVPLAGVGTASPTFSLYNHAGSTNALFDVGGRFVAYPPATSGNTRYSYPRPAVLGATLSRG